MYYHSTSYFGSSFARLLIFLKKYSGTTVLILYHGTHTVPRYSYCTTVLILYHGTHSVPWYSYCTTVLILYHGTHTVLRYSYYTKVLILYHGTHSISLCWSRPVSTLVLNIFCTKSKLMVTIVPLDFYANLNVLLV